MKTCVILNPASGAAKNFDQLAEKFKFRAYETTITLDGIKSSSRSLHNVIIGNGRYVAGGIPVAPKAELDDGLLDIILIPELPAGKSRYSSHKF